MCLHLQWHVLNQLSFHIEQKERRKEKEAFLCHKALQLYDFFLNKKSNGVHSTLKDSNKYTKNCSSTKIVLTVWWVHVIKSNTNGYFYYLLLIIEHCTVPISTRYKCRWQLVTDVPQISNIEVKCVERKLGGFPSEDITSLCVVIVVAIEK